MNILVALSLIVLSVSAIFSLYYQYQMLQQNSYYLSRFFTWLKDSYVLYVCGETFLYCIISVMYLKRSYITITVLGLIVLAFRIAVALRIKKRVIKPLVFTARVKRLYATSVLILGITIVLYCLFSRKAVGQAAVIAVYVLSLVTPIICMLTRIINSPVEYFIGRYYINDAKRILKSHKDLKVIGITGSYGKTTTKFILNRILSEKYNTVCTPQSFNTPLGVVRTIREKLKNETEIFICEMGAKKVGDIKEICDIVNPQYGIITSVGEQHLDTFRSVDNVFKTKFELYNAVMSVDGICLANIESKGIYDRKHKCEKAVFFGEGTKYYADNIKYSSCGSTFDLHLDGKLISVTSKLLGKHSVADILSAAALADILGVPDIDIKFAISSLTPTEHRLELKTFKGGSLLIDDAYNSNPEGCIEAVNVLGSFEGMKKVIITPGLVELGEREYDCNYSLGKAAASVCDIIILVGKNRSVPLKNGVSDIGFKMENLYIVSSFKEAMDIYLPIADKNSILLIENDLPDNYLN